MWSMIFINVKVSVRDKIDRTIKYDDTVRDHP